MVTVKNCQMKDASPIANNLAIVGPDVPFVL